MRILAAMLRTVIIRLIPNADTSSTVVIVGRQSNNQIAVNHVVSDSGEAAITVLCRSPVWQPQSAHSLQRWLLMWRAVSRAAARAAALAGF